MNGNFMTEEKLSILKTDRRKEKWRELRDKLKEHGYENMGTISKRLDKAIQIALWTLEKKEDEIKEVKEEWCLP